MYKISENNLIREIDRPSNISKLRNHLYGNLIDKSLIGCSLPPCKFFFFSYLIPTNPAFDDGSYKDSVDKILSNLNNI